MSEQWTLKKLLEWSSDYFEQKGFESARLESEILLAHLLNLRRLDLYLQFERPLSSAELTDYKALIKRRLDHEPSAYIVGYREFWSKKFFVTPDVLIPRPDTESLIELILDHWSAQTDRPRWQGFELGLGSGNISLTLLSEISDLEMTGVDVSSEAIAICQKNTEFHGLEDRLQIINANFLDGNVVPQDGQFNLIVSNPPYISEDQMEGLSQTVKDFEPHKALVADDQGLIFYKKLMSFANQHLLKDGLIAVEIGEDQGQAVEEIFKEAGLCQVTIKKDYGGRDRVVSGQRGN